MDTPLENEEDGALKLTLPKESHDLDRDSQDLSEEFEKAATYGGNENESCIRIFKRRVEEKTIDNIYARNNLFGILSSR
ncbi:hypothetical protein KY285_005887 [Solanum tuberosum]|nr:hypothetical protein KY285_005887 [Solanum tuberosum]